MTIHLISFTESGARISEKISKRKIVFNNENTRFFQVYAGAAAVSLVSDNNLDDKTINKKTNIKVSSDKSKIRIEKSGLKNYIGKCFKNNEPVVFIGACGIAVRLIAPFIKSKLTDIPVIVTDEQGRYVIPVLSGHFGGANELAEKIAHILNACCVITTATDIEDKFAVDIFAKKNGLNINDKNMIAYVSSKVLAGKKVSLKIKGKFLFDKDKVPDELTLLPDESKKVPDILITDDKEDINGKLILYPKSIILGIGCKRETKAADISKFVRKVLKANGFSLDDVLQISSIDLKKDEEGLKEFAVKNRIGFVTYSADELSKVRGTFSSSEFVRSKTGVDNVCERASVKACGRGGELVVSKQSSNGITVAVSKRKVRLSFDV